MKLLLIVALAVTAEPQQSKSRGVVKLSDEAKRIHAEALVIDGHNDLPWAMRDKGDPFTPVLDIAKPQPKLHTDIPRLRQGNVGAQFWSAYVPAELMKKGTAVKATLEQIDLIHRMVKKYPDVFAMASTADDIVRLRKEGKIASLIGVEGGHSIDNSLGVLRTYYDLGVRYMTLTHSDNLDWADSATDVPKNKGLTQFGERVVLEMNRLGMLVDISHVSADTMRHTLKVTKAPVIASHSSAFALAPHPRNVPDSILTMVKANGGVVMVNFNPGFLSEAVRVNEDSMAARSKALRAAGVDTAAIADSVKVWTARGPKATLAQAADHIEHIRDVAGIDHVGLGSDFDGITEVPVGLEDVSKFPDLIAELLRRGWNEEDVRKVAGLNALRVLRTAERVAVEMRKGKG